MSEDLKCECCGNLAAGVAASPLGPISHAYCRDCLQKKIEPLRTVLATMSCVGDKREAFAPWALEIIDASLKFYNWDWDMAVAESDRINRMMQDEMSSPSSGSSAEEDF